MSRRTELQIFDSFRPLAEKHGQVHELGEVDLKEFKLPLYGLTIGTAPADAPCFGLFAGVHGLERVGSHVALHYIKTLLERLEWDDSLQELFKKVRVVALPMVNPGGLYLSTRSNPSGVDIMRNAPIEGSEKGIQLVSGHKISPKLPWYRGDSSKMEVETKTLIEFVRTQMFPSRFSLALDIHSGFGVKDRLWYPYSHSSKDFPDTKTVKRFKNLMNRSIPHHVYKLEKQTDSYIIHGDPWDFLYLEHQKKYSEQSTFIPWCLEMGSWSWLRKNPRQIFARAGLFNPILPHRYKRIMRRHLSLLDLFLRATLNHQNWSS